MDRGQPHHYPFAVEAGSVRRFREAAWDVRPGLDNVPVPPTYLGAAPSLAGQPHSLHLMGFDVARAFHGSETIEMLGPVRPGAHLAVRESYASLSPVRGRRGGLMSRARRSNDFTDDHGHLVARSDRVILETAQPVEPPTTAPDRGFDDGLNLPRDPWPTNEPHADSSAPAPVAFGPLTMVDLVRYAGASGDLTGVHVDELAAAAHGYPAPFAMGMLSAAFVGQAVERWFRPTPPWRLEVRFRDLVWPGETLSVSTAAAPVSSTWSIDCRVADRLVTSAVLHLVPSGTGEGPSPHAESPR